MSWRVDISDQYQKPRVFFGLFSKQGVDRGMAAAAALDGEV